MDKYSYKSRQTRRNMRRRQIHLRRLALVVVLLLISLVIVKLIKADEAKEKPGDLSSINKSKEDNVNDGLSEHEPHGEDTPDDDSLLPTEEEPIIEDTRITVVVDPGHGGRDPGMIGINGEIEKDINLSIGLKLKDHLEKNGYKVIMTRDGDYGLYSESDSNKKMADLEKRAAIINQEEVELAISIHQNSFDQESVKGGQVFYHDKSQEGEILSNIIQEQLKMTVQTYNTRLAASNGSYYLLRQTNCPTIIVECGFLSNNEEARLLSDDDYQDKMAEGIYMGLDTYIKARQ